MGTKLKLTYTSELFLRRINMHRANSGDLAKMRNTVTNGIVTAHALGTRKAAERLFNVHVYALGASEAKKYLKTHTLGNGSWL